ncbi:hypothetical protein [Sorangium sp. So ce124]|uniref:hypothetical protein n=1 Tax=Sorangium sp. So ce124 TaxID=3133280 RepID=UPI003F5ECFA1
MIEWFGGARQHRQPVDAHGPLGEVYGSVTVVVANEGRADRRQDERGNEAAFGARFQGAGPRWAAIQRLFEVHCQRLGLNRARVGDATDEAEERSTFRRPSRQGTLFDL